MASLGTGPNGGALYSTGRARTFTVSGAFDGNQIVVPQFISGVLVGGVSRATSNSQVSLWTFGGGHPIVAVNSGGVTVYAAGTANSWTFNLGMVGISSDDYTFAYTGTYTASYDVQEVFEVLFSTAAKDDQNDGPYYAKILWYEILKPGGHFTITASMTVNYSGTDSGGTPFSGSASGTAASSSTFALTPLQVVNQPLGYRPDIYAYCWCLDGHSAYADMSGTYGDNYGASFAMSQPHSFSDSFVSCDLSTGVSVTATSLAIASAGSSDITESAMFGENILSAPRIAHLDWRLRAMDQPYPPNNVVCHYQPISVLLGSDALAISQSTTRTDTQQAYAWQVGQTPGPGNSLDPVANLYAFERQKGGAWNFVGLPGTIGTNVFNPIAPATASVDGSWLGSNGEYPGDTRCQFSGTRWDAFTLEHNDPLTVEPMNDITHWTAGAHTSVSVVSGGLQFDVSGGGGSAVRSVVAGDPAVVVPAGSALHVQEWSSHRFLPVSAKSLIGSNKPLRLTIRSPYGPVSKVWYLQTGTAGSFATRILDLRAPDSLTASDDAQDSRFPLPTVDGPLWGVTYIDQITVDNLASGESYVIAPLALTRENYAEVTFLPAALRPSRIPNAAGDDPYAVIPLTGSTYPDVVRGTLGIVDGRQALEEPYMYHVLTGSPAHDSYQARTLTQLIADIASHPGWSATAGSSFPADGYHDNSLAAAYAWGGGAVYDPATSPVWTEGFALDVSSPLTVQAQALWDYVDWYPMCGDVWSGLTGYDPANLGIPLAVNKIFRGGGHGLLLQDDNSPYAGEVVSAVEVIGSVASGSGTADSTGFFETGLPYGKTPVTGTGGAVVPAMYDMTPLDIADTLRRPWYSRKRTAAAWRAPGQTTKVDNDHHASGNYARVREQAGNLLISRSDLPTPAAPVGWAIHDMLVTSAGTDRAPAVRWALRPGRRLYLVFDRLTGGSRDVWETHSDDQGATWDSPLMSIPSGQRPRTLTRADGSRLTGAYVGGPSGNVQFVVWDGTGANVAAGPYTALDTTGTPIVITSAGFGMSQARDGTGRIVAVWTIQGETDPSEWASVDLGLHWRRL